MVQIEKIGVAFPAKLLNVSPPGRAGVSPGSPWHGQEIDGESGENPERSRHCMARIKNAVRARLPAWKDGSEYPRVTGVLEQIIQ